MPAPGLSTKVRMIFSAARMFIPEGGGRDTTDAPTAAYGPGAPARSDNVIDIRKKF